MEDYTDKPFVYDVETRVRVPRNGFKGCGDSYTVDDAFMCESDLEKYTVAPEDVLRLKLCFDRINRKSKKETCDDGGDQTSVATRNWRKRRETLRAAFNARYFRLKQLAVRTRYRYNMRNYIVTPPIKQCTHQYYTMLRRLCRLDGLPPRELQAKRVFIKQDRRAACGRSTNTAGQRGGSRHHALPRPTAPFRMNNESLQKLWKALHEVDLVNKSIKDQTQGGKSFLKQVVVPGKLLNCLYGKVLPDPTLRPDEIGIPGHLMEGAFHPADTNKVAAIVKRDPVFSSDAITTFTRVVRNPYSYITLPSEIITNKQLDYDGDTVSVLLVHSGRCFLETLLRLSAKISMYCYFYRTRLTFSQTNGFRIAGLLKHLRERATAAATEPAVEEVRTVSQLFGTTFAHCRYSVHDGANVLWQLNETLLSLAQQYGPFVAYGFVMNARSLSFTGYNAGRIYPIGPDALDSALHIAESGSKGSAEAVRRMFSVSSTKESRSIEALEYAKTFIRAKTLIRKQGHNAKKMDSAFQNIIVDYDDHLVVRVNNKVYDLGHLLNYMQREWIMSDLTASTILDGVVEDESAFCRIALRCDRSGAVGIDATERGTSKEQETRRNNNTELWWQQQQPGVEDTRYYAWDSVIEEALYR